LCEKKELNAKKEIGNCKGNSVELVGKTMPKLLEKKICKSENGKGKNVEKPPRPFRFSCGYLYWYH